jgi:hypothetical protein
MEQATILHWHLSKLGVLIQLAVLEAYVGENLRLSITISTIPSVPIIMERDQLVKNYNKDE